MQTFPEDVKLIISLIYNFLLTITREIIYPLPVFFLNLVKKKKKHSQNNLKINTNVKVKGYV